MEEDPGHPTSMHGYCLCGMALMVGAIDWTFQSHPYSLTVNSKVIQTNGSNSILQPPYTCEEYQKFTMKITPLTGSWLTPKKYLSWVKLNCN